MKPAAAAWSQPIAYGVSPHSCPGLVSNFTWEAHKILNQQNHTVLYLLKDKLRQITNVKSLFEKKSVCIEQRQTRRG